LETEIARAHQEVALLAAGWKPPKVVAHSTKTARPDQDNEMDASEYLDDEDTLASKVKAVAALIRAARHCVCYTGAGISKSSGIPDYATKAKNTVAKISQKLKDPADAQPSLAHDALASMHRAGLVKEFVNQNHDGLFEKAGVSPLHSNLIHGDWFDVANLVVQYDEDLRGDLHKRLLISERKADLVLVAGSSLSGMTADRIATTCGKMWEAKRPDVLGMVLVNLQKTNEDDRAIVRVFCKTDDFFRMLAEELAVPVENVRLSSIEEDVFHIPYDLNGKRLRDGDSRLLVLDLRPNARVKVVHPKANNLGNEYIMGPKRDVNGNWKIGLRPKGRFVEHSRFGTWFMQAALKGELEHLSFVNVDAQFRSDDTNGK